MYGWIKLFLSFVLYDHFSPFQINTQLRFILHKMAAGGHFGWSYFSRFYIRSIRNFCCWFFQKMAAGDHFGWPKIIFDCISRHFRLIRNFFLQNFEVRFGSFWMTEKSLSIALLAISDQYPTLYFPKWTPAAILEIWFAPKTIGFFHYVLSMAMPNMKLIGEYMTQLETPQAFWAFVCKMAARCHFVFPRIDAKNHKVLVIWNLNGYGENEFNWCICDKVMTCTSVVVLRWQRWRRQGNQKHNTPTIFKFRRHNCICSYITCTSQKQSVHNFISIIHTFQIGRMMQYWYRYKNNTTCMYQTQQQQ